MAYSSRFTDMDARSTTETNPTSDIGTSSESPTSTHTAYSTAALLPPAPQVVAPPPLVRPSQATLGSQDDKKVLGWPQLAQVMAEKQGLESFSRFRELNIKNLLYYQAELACLEADLTSVERNNADARGTLRGNHAKNAGRLVKPPNTQNETPQDREQRDLVFEIRRTLKEYNQAFLLYKQVSEAPEPDYQDVEQIQKWLNLKEYGGNRCIEGRGATTWGPICDPDLIGCHEPILKRLVLLPFRLFWPRHSPEVEKLDLVTLPPQQKPDAFVYWISHELVPLYDQIRKRLFPDISDKPGIDDPEAANWQSPSEKQKKIADKLKKKKAEEREKQKDRKKQDIFDTYSGAKMQIFASSVATVVACVLPTISIGILATAEGLVRRLLYIGGFTALFAIGLMFLTDADTSRVHIFTATAAFSAVLVVFVQGQ
ncbi:hypothetical protein B0H63DRAFT_488849 [Podospora didyma]|uniref:DUF6594 domain-containing protein n=1 Tax=Podospora didyma TaxID=330526 RepID=A0AAE0N2S8_9PEZI|nr:hypothetical protein B0H63DRAFT_488849 [Podospora didyma]